MDLERVLAEAIALGDQGDWDGMVELLKSGLEEDSEDPYLLCWMGVAQRELGNDSAAYEFFRRSLAEEPLDPDLLALVGSGLAAFDDPEAEAALRAAALSGPDNPSARLQYGAYLSRAGLFAEALEQLNAARKLAGDDPAVRGELGIAYALKGDFDSAVSELETALDLAPDDAWTRFILGLTLVEMKRMEEAAEQLLQAAEERPEDAEAQIVAALAAAAVRWDDAAQDCLARAEYSTEGSDDEVREEAEERVAAGPREAEALLIETLGPSILRERLAQPL